MYEIYFENITYDQETGSEVIDRKLVYRSGTFIDEYRIVSPRFSQELGQAGELSFRMCPPDNMWEGDEVSIENRYFKLMTFVYIYKNDRCIWRGRVLNDSKDFFGNKNINCEGQLAMLHDVNAFRYSFGYGDGPHFDGDPRHTSEALKPKALLQKFIDMNNRHSKTNKDIYMGDFVSEKQDVALQVKSDEFNTILDEMNAIFCSQDNLYGYFTFHYEDLFNEDGTFKRTKTYLDYLKYDDPTIHSDQMIKFGENLVDLSENIDGSSIYTLIIPLGDYTTNYKCKKCGKYINVINDDVKNTVLWKHLKTHNVPGTNPDESVISDYFSESEQGPRLAIENVNIEDGTKYHFYPPPKKQKTDPLVLKYGWIEKTVIFDGVKDPNVLLDKAIAERSTINMIDTLEIKAIDLQMAGYNVDEISLGDMVMVNSRVHGVYKMIQCTGVDLDFENPSQNIYTFGTKASGITDDQIYSEKIAEKNKNAIASIEQKR